MWPVACAVLHEDAAEAFGKGAAVGADDHCFLLGKVIEGGLQFGEPLHQRTYALLIFFDGINALFEQGHDAGFLRGDFCDIALKPVNLYIENGCVNRPLCLDVISSRRLARCSRTEFSSSRKLAEPQQPFFVQRM